MLDKITKIFNSEGIDTEIYQIGGKLVHGCVGCLSCRMNHSLECVFNDEVNTCIEKMINADIIIIGTPVYFSGVTPEIKALIDRSGYVTRGNGNLLKGKIGAAVAAVRRAGAIPALDTIHHFFLVNEMIIPGSSYWNLCIGRNPGEILHDDEGMTTIKNLAKNTAYLAKKLFV